MKARRYVSIKKLGADFLWQNTTTRKTKEFFKILNIKALKKSKVYQLC